MDRVTEDADLHVGARHGRELEGARETLVALRVIVLKRDLVVAAAAVVVVVTVMIMVMVVVAAAVVVVLVVVALVMAVPGARWSRRSCASCP